MRFSHADARTVSVQKFFFRVITAKVVCLFVLKKEMVCLEAKLYL